MSSLSLAGMIFATMLVLMAAFGLVQSAHVHRPR